MNYIKKANKHVRLKESSLKKGRKTDAKYHGLVAQQIRGKKRNLTHKEKKDAFKKASAADSLKSMGASANVSNFIAASSKGKRFRVRYGRINEDKLGDLSNSKLTKATNSLDKAIDDYKKLNWISTHDGKGRRFIVIESSNDGGKTWNGKLMSNAQHF